MPKINKLPTEEELYTKFSRLCATTEYAPADIKLKVLRSGLGIDIAERLIDRLIDENFINEERYVRAFVHDKFEFNHWGRRKIALALSQKGLRQNLISEALKYIDEDAYKSALANILRAKAQISIAEAPRKHFAKLTNFAVSRGFELDLVYKTVEQIISSLEQETDDQ